ncbi:blue copper protein-like, partial [Aristolochia californica]|uniref:blue copper protein-like n=1 Tax=Aristolochia californica TaxID=171875 RepID=UPI0035DE2DD0
IERFISIAASIKSTSSVMARLFVVIVLVAFLSLSLHCHATVYTVGDTAGWDISTDLGSWLSGKEFNVGDTLLFQYSSLHSVSEVGKDDFDACSAGNALQSSRGGNTTIPLTSPGPKYFICGTLSHCLGGMKLQVNVNGRDAASPAGAPTSPETSEEAPSSLPRPNTRSNSPATPSNAYSPSLADSLMAVWFSFAGALLWVLAVF